MAGIIEVLRLSRVGGTYWGARPKLPSAYVLVRSEDAVAAAGTLAAGEPIVVWYDRPAAVVEGEWTVGGECDPWHMVGGASAVVADPDDDVTLVAAIVGVPAYCIGSAGNLERDPGNAAAELRSRLRYGLYEDPFGGRPIPIEQAIGLCRFWRELIDSNRGIAAALGFAFWKQQHVAPLLWGGERPVPFVRSLPASKTRAPVAIWRSKTPSGTLLKLEQSGVPLIEVEDGFLRSQGLGADCIPPLSITVDRRGAYFDPAEPSELELLIQDGVFSSELLERARRLRELIVDAGLGKYEVGANRRTARRSDRRQILVPGQVEDDRAVQRGGCGLVTNLDLLRKVRAAAPEAYILYKPHPDVLAGHRKGAIAQRDCLEHADEIVTNESISALIAVVDEVHVNTSLTGFEALLREKAVVTYGVPFYAGWGLTRDMGPVPRRRTAVRSVDELVAAALLLYPRYLDPVTGLPCPAEIVVERLTSRHTGSVGLTVMMRRLQGKLMRGLRSLMP